MNGRYRAAVDSGNSRTSAAIFELPNMECMRKAEVDTDTELNMNLEDIFSAFSKSFPLESVSVASVSGEDNNKRIYAALEKFFKRDKIHTVGSNNISEKLSGYLDPGSLGSDRIANTFYCMRCVPEESCVIVDAGSAVTIDCVSKHVGFMGGYIIPGIHSQMRMLEALSGIPKAEKEINVSSSIPSSTLEGINSGILNSVSGAIKAAFDAMQKKIESSDTCVIIGCGGDSGYLYRRTGIVERVDYNATLKGCVAYSELLEAT